MKLTQDQIDNIEKNIETSDGVFEAIQTAARNTYWLMGIDEDEVEIEIEYTIKVKQVEDAK